MLALSKTNKQTKKAKKLFLGKKATLSARTHQRPKF